MVFCKICRKMEIYRKGNFHSLICFKVRTYFNYFFLFFMFQFYTYFCELYLSILGDNLLKSKSVVRKLQDDIFDFIEIHHIQQHLKQRFCQYIRESTIISDFPKSFNKQLSPYLVSILYREFYQCSISLHIGHVCPKIDETKTKLSLCPKWDFELFDRLLL